MAGSWGLFPSPFGPLDPEVSSLGRLRTLQTGPPSPGVRLPLTPPLPPRRRVSLCCWLLPGLLGPRELSSFSSQGSPRLKKHPDAEASVVLLCGLPLPGSDCGTSRLRTLHILCLHFSRELLLQHPPCAQAAFCNSTGIEGHSSHLSELSRDVPPSG